MDWTTVLIFWIAAGLIAYTFAGYPLLMFALGRAAGRAIAADRVFRPAISVVLVVKNEGKRLLSRLANLLDADVSLEELEIVVVSDGPDEEAAMLAGEFPEVRFIGHGESRGKAACLNDGVREANGEVVVFADARQEFDRHAISALASWFANDAVGAVSGELLIRDAKTGTGAGVDAYWRLEKMIRNGESSIDSAIGCTGAVYAIRRDDYTPLPEDTILDDVVCPMQIALKGKRVLFDAKARAFDPQSLDPGTEMRRKTRTLAGNFQMLFRHPQWLVPWRNRLWLQLVSHKYLRLVAPVLLVLLLVSNVALAWNLPFYRAMLAGQAAFYVLAVVGICVKSLKLPLFTLPAGFVFLNFMTVRGFLYFLGQQGRTGW